MHMLRARPTLLPMAFAALPAIVALATLGALADPPPAHFWAADGAADDRQPFALGGFPISGPGSRAAALTEGGAVCTGSPEACDIAATARGGTLLSRSATPFFVSWLAQPDTHSAVMETDFAPAPSHTVAIWVDGVDVVSRIELRSGLAWTEVLIGGGVTWARLSPKAEVIASPVNRARALP